MGKDKGEHILKLMRELQNAPELELVIKLEALKSSYILFRDNYRELIAPLEKLQTLEVAIPLMDRRRSGERLRVWQELTRLLHNFLASAKSLIDHTRVHMNSIYSDAPLFTEYEGKVKNLFSQSPIQHFVQDLRNYTQHYKLPVAGSTFTWDRTQGTSITYHISKEELLKWDKWSPEARKYMDKFKDNIPLKQLADDYFSLIDEFYKWLNERQREINKPALERYREKIKELRDAEAEDEGMKDN